METSEVSSELNGLFTIDNLTVLLRSMVVLIAGFIILHVVCKILRKYTAKHYTAQLSMVIIKTVYYLGFAILVLTVLTQLKFNLTPLLGAAGIIGIAVGFASQTSVSNIISGIFLIAEKPFVVNDIVTIGGTTGQVLSIDLLSVKLRTFDNKMVRIPNESIIKTELINITRFPIRRVDLKVGVAYKENIGRVREILLDVAQKNPLCLQEPEPLVIFTGFGNSSIDLLFAVWAIKSDWLTLKNTIQEEIKARFDKDGVEIPFPHLSLYKGQATEPFPIRLVNADLQNTERES